MRLFLAIELSDTVRAGLKDAQNRLQAASQSDVKWVEPENLHLTVHFLGDMGAPLLPDVETACENLAKTTKAFRFGVCGVSVFPRKAPIIKTIWAAVTEGADAWKTVAQEAENALTLLGAAKANNQLVPHLTLGRVKSERPMDALKAAISSEAQTDFGTQTARQIVLMQSFLNSDGAVHKVVRAWDLSTNIGS